jgi:predicted enzyme related to lactoylglutathione lyase
MRTVVYPVTDLASATALYTTLLGVGPHTETPYYVGFSAGGQEVGLDPNGHGSGMTGPVGYWHVDDLAGTLRRLLDAGAATVQEPRDVGGGKLIATVKDADGNVIGLVQEP